MPGPDVMDRLHAQGQEAPYRLACVRTVRLQKVCDDRDGITWKREPDFSRRTMRIRPPIGHQRTPPPGCHTRQRCADRVLSLPLISPGHNAEPALCVT